MNLNIIKLVIVGLLRSLQVHNRNLILTSKAIYIIKHGNRTTSMLDNNSFDVGKIIICRWVFLLFFFL